MKKITVQEYNNFLSNLYNKPFNQRLGQFFCNKFEIQDDKLFYEKNNKKAMEIIVTYINS
jgi:hypothetical protein